MTEKYEWAVLNMWREGTLKVGPTEQNARAFLGAMRGFEAEGKAPQGLGKLVRRKVTEWEEIPDYQPSPDSEPRG